MGVGMGNWTHTRGVVLVAQGQIIRGKLALGGLLVMICLLIAKDMFSGR